MASELTENDCQQLALMIGVSNIEVRLLYSASSHGCSERIFHQRCDGQSPTISVGYTNDGFVYGGYASVPFDSSNSWKQDNNAFLFTLKRAGSSEYIKYPATKSHIFCHTTYGPAFGNGAGLELFFFQGMDRGNQRLLHKSMRSGSTMRLNRQVSVGTLGAFDSRGQSPVYIAGNSMVFQDIKVYHIIRTSSTSNIPPIEAEETDSKVEARNHKPWRTLKTGWTEQDLKRVQVEVADYKPPLELSIPQANILLVGQVGAGKSSFCNTVNSLFRGHVTAKAACGSSERSLTTTFRKYEFRNKFAGKSMRFRLCDTMGLEESHKLDSINFPHLLDGNIRDRFEFNPTVPVKPGIEGYEADPKLKDKMHVVAFVIDGSTANLLSGELLDKLKAMRVLVIQRGIPLMILMTKVDKLDQPVSENLQNIYLSVDVRETVEELSNKTGVPMSYIMPVKSYERETELELPIDILALTALRQMLRLADDFFEDQMDMLGILPGCESSSDGDEKADFRAIPIAKRNF